MMNCPYCGKLTDPKLESCPHCGGPMHVKTPQPNEVTAARASHWCPSCKSPVQDGDIICVRCGTNLLTGEKIAAGRTVEAPEGERRTWIWIASAVMMALILVAGLAGAYIYLSRDPVQEALRLGQAGDVLEAINVLETYVSSHPKRAEAQLLLGKLRWQQGQDYSRAAEAFREAANLDDRDSSAGMLAVVAATRIPGEDGRTQTINALRREVERRPESSRARYLLALALGVNQDYASEIQELRQVLAETPNDPEARRALGLAYALSGDIPAAVRELEEVLQLQPDDGAAGAALGMVMNLQGNSREAAARLTQALGSGASVPPAVRTRLGLLYLEQGNVEQALPLLRDARSDPKPDPAAQFFYAVCLHAGKLDSEALVEYDRTISAGGPFAADAATLSSIIYLQQGMLQRASDTVARAIQLGGPSAERYTIQGRIRLLEGDENEAQQAFRNAIRTDPDYAAAHLESGLLYVGRGVLSEGLRALERYLALVGDSTAGTRAPEIELLVNQLRQTLEGGAGAPSR